MFAVRKNVPLPERASTAPNGTPKKYPFAAMDVGDSFVVPINDNPAKAVRQRIAASIQNHRRTAGRDRKFSVRLLDNELGVWRVA